MNHEVKIVEAPSVHKAKSLFANTGFLCIGCRKISKGIYKVIVVN